MSMFCYQCQETARNQGCTVRGVCGKSEEVAILQDLLIDVLKGIAFYAQRARAAGASDEEADRFLMESLFTTITNVNFSPEDLQRRIAEALAVRDRVRAAAGEVEGPLPEAATWLPDDSSIERLVERGRAVGLKADAEQGEDIASLRHLVLFGLKGMAAYADHAAVLGHMDDEVLAFIERALAATVDDSLSVDEMISLVLEVGSFGVRTMALLDEANTSRYGHPEPTEVNLGVKPGPAILISGHDLLDLEELLDQTQGKGINVYTHGEMLPANAYPFFRKYDHLVGNYGGSWWHQTTEFESFGGAILMTTNCLVPPKGSYQERVFTTGVVSYPEMTHIPDREPGGHKDFSPVIAKALESGQPEELETGTITIGFARNTIMSVADKVIEAVQSGAVKRLVVMAGCDGRQRVRQYFTDIAEGLPEDSIILTAGCAKYRYNKLDLGTIGGFPRVLDAGQCNDSYSLAYVALQLKEALGLEDINDLPIVYDIAWYEQKAVLVLLALLSLGVKNIHLGPTLPAFLSPTVAKVIVDTFGLQQTTTVEEDLAVLTA